ncbi:MAG: hypothetical protein MJB14_19230 [Spirochaetes bacterium]|nr:hypothetical protein [Spirochaetota bacterium]
MNFKILLILLYLVCTFFYINGQDATSDQKDSFLDDLLENDDTDDFYKKAGKNKQKSEQAEEMPQTPPLLASFTFAHALSIMYNSGSSMPMPLYNVSFNTKVPFNVKNPLVSKGFFSVGITNMVAIAFDRVSLKLQLAPIPFIDFYTAFSGWFYWKLQNESALYVNDESVSAAGYTVDLGMSFKVPFRMLHPKVKLVMLNTANFQFISYPQYDVWETKMTGAETTDHWVFKNTFMLMWMEKYFAPFLGCDVSFAFNRLDDINLKLSGGFRWMLPKKTGLNIMASAGIDILKDDPQNNISVLFILSHKIAEIKVPKNWKEIREKKKKEKKKEKNK